MADRVKVTGTRNGKPTFLKGNRKKGKKNGK
jgi:hypothetical protein